MPKKALLQTTPLTEKKSLKTLVENRTIFSLEACELNVFETYEKSDRVPLKFNDLVVTSMLRGKKIMHLPDEPAFDYVPGETVIVPQQVEMKIDFPEANLHNPTQCIALAIDKNLIKKTLHYLNERFPKSGDGNTWNINDESYFLYNNEELAATISKLIKECMSTDITKDAIANLTLQELIIRIVQNQAIQKLQNNTAGAIKSSLAPAIQYIQSNIQGNFNLKDLSNKSCMSATNFYRLFKRELGMSPIAYILNQKIKYAKSLLKEKGMNISEVSYASGFDDANYFTRLFKKYEGVTPSQYQMMHVSA
jgi:AraC-like DNA-binding protein